MAALHEGSQGLNAPLNLRLCPCTQLVCRQNLLRLSDVDPQSTQRTPSPDHPCAVQVFPTQLVKTTRSYPWVKANTTQRPILKALGRVQRHLYRDVQHFVHRVVEAPTQDQPRSHSSTRPSDDQRARHRKLANQRS